MDFTNNHHNLSYNANSLQALNRFQDFYYPSHPKVPNYPVTYKPPYPPDFHPESSTTSKISDHTFNDRILFGGWGGWNSGSSPGWGWHSGGNSAAVSALGLLSFLFFLNLIQNTLVNSRFNLLTFANVANNQANNLVGRDGSKLNPWIMNKHLSKVQKRLRRATNASNAEKSTDHIPIEAILDYINLKDENNKSISEVTNQTTIIHEPSLKKESRQLNLNPNSNYVPFKCFIQLYVCRLSRILDPYKILLNQNRTLGFSRRLLQLNVKNLFGQTAFQESLIFHQRTRQSCRKLFNNCKNVMTLPIFRVQRPIG